MKVSFRIYNIVGCRKKNVGGGGRNCQIIVDVYFLHPTNFSSISFYFEKTVLFF